MKHFGPPALSLGTLGYNTERHHRIWLWYRTAPPSLEEHITGESDLQPLQAGVGVRWESAGTLPDLSEGAGNFGRGMRGSRNGKLLLAETLFRLPALSPLTSEKWVALRAGERCVDDSMSGLVR